MKIVIILVVLLALIGGGGFAAWTFMPEVVRPLLGMDVPAGMEKPKPPPPTSVIDLEPMVLPLFENGTVRRFFVMEISVEVYQPDGPVQLQRQLPRLQDAYLVYLLSLQSKGMGPGQVDLEFLKERLLKVTRDVLGPNVVHDLLFKNVFERPVS